MLANRVREFTLTTGTGDIVLGGALAGHIPFSEGFSAGDSITYVVEDGDDYEIGIGTLIDDTTLERTSVAETLVAGVYDKANPTPITLSGNAKVFCTVTADFLLDPGVDADVIREVTADAGVTIDGVLLKDGAVDAAGATFGGPLFIETSSIPGTPGADPGSLIRIDRNANASLQINSGNTNNGQVRFGDGESNYRGAVSYNHSNDTLSLVAAGVQQVDISSTLFDVATAAQFGSTVTLGDLSAASPTGALRIKSDANEHAIYLEEPTGGGENWGIGVNADGDLVWYNGASSPTPSVVFKDDHSISVLKGADFGGDLTVQGTTISVGADMRILSSVSTSDIDIVADTNINSGSGIRLYGSGHPTNAGDYLVRSNGTNVKFFDSSSSRWDYLGTSVTGIADINMTGTATMTNIVRPDNNSSISLSGGNTTTTGAVLTLTGSDHASQPSQVIIKDGTDRLLNYAANTWDFNQKAIANTPVMIGVSEAGTIGVTGGASSTTGGRLVFYGSTHATQANDMEFYASASKALQYDASISAWNFHGNFLLGVDSLIRSSSSDFMQVAGGSAGGSGGNILLYGESHASFANDIWFRSGVSNRLVWDNSATRWDYIGTSIVGVGDVTADSITLDANTTHITPSAGIAQLDFDFPDSAGADRSFRFGRETNLGGGTINFFILKGDGNGSVGVKMTGDGDADFAGRLHATGGADFGTDVSINNGQIDLTKSTATMINFDRTIDANIDNVFSMYVSSDGSAATDFFGIGSSGSFLKVYGSGAVSVENALNIEGDVTLAAAVNTNSYFRFTENQLQGFFINPDHDANILHIGTHNTSDSDTANDVNAISINRGSANVTIHNQFFAVGDATFSGGVTAPNMSLSGGVLSQTIGTDSMSVSGGPTSFQGANAIFRGQLHDLEANDTRFRFGTETWLHHDVSASTLTISPELIVTSDVTIGGALNASSLPEYADDTAAAAAGLSVGDIYRTPTGELRFKL